VPPAMTREAALAEIRSLRSEIEEFEKESNMGNQDPLASLPPDQRKAVENYLAQKAATDKEQSEVQAIMRKPNATLTTDDLEKLRQYAVEQGRREGWL
jgi:hypothetical protein